MFSLMSSQCYQLSIKNVKVAARETISIYRLNDWMTKWQVKWSSCREPNSNLTCAVVDPKEITTNQEKDLPVRMDSFQLLLSSREETLPTEVYRVLMIICKGVEAKAGVITILHLIPSTRVELKKVQ